MKSPDTPQSHDEAVAGDHKPAEQFEVFKLFEECAEWIWDQVDLWPLFAKEAIGLQLVKSIDSVGANLVEGDGRYSTSDSLRFFIFARASAREARLWLRRAIKRKLVNLEVGEEYVERITSGLKQLNLLINYRKRAKADNLVSEVRRPYGVEECFWEDHL